MTHEVSEVFGFVHVLVQLLITGPRVLEDAQCQLVLVEVVVKGDGEHDRHHLVALFGSHVKQLIGQDAHGAGGRVIVLGEGANLGFGGAHCGLWRAVDESALNVHPGDRKKSSG